MLSNSTALQVIPEASLFDRGWRFLMSQLIQDVPDSIAVCEFNCRETDCSAERWASCERRLLHASRERVPKFRK